MEITTKNIGLLSTRFSNLAENTYETIGYFQNSNPTQQMVLDAIATAPVTEDASLQLYIHVPYCAQKCRFCAFTGANSVSTKNAERYAELVLWQLNDMLKRTQVKGHHIESVHIGGGSPDLLGKHIGTILKGVRDIAGCDNNTEISVEMAISTAKSDFIEELVRYQVTKTSFGIQTFDPRIRKSMRQPGTLKDLPRVINMINGRIPIVNADLMTGLPGQTLQIALKDLQTLIEYSGINAISSHLFTSCAAPSIIKGILLGDLPPQASQQDQALMRLYTFSMLRQQGWEKGGTVTFVNTKKVPREIINLLSGNECHGQSHFGAFQVSAGVKAISSMPGIQLENISSIDEWCEIVERGEQPFFLPKCSVKELKDVALWAFPLRPEGLPKKRYEWMIKNNALSSKQIETLSNLCKEGLVIETNKGYDLSILGEVFRGHLIRELKKEVGQKAAANFVAEGKKLGQMMAAGLLEDKNLANNRQLVDHQQTAC
jgi:oxygen-independent coproporphyrinogen-3 oxidase